MNALPQSSAAAGGFTLVELLVSFTVLGMTLALLFSALWFSVRSWDAAGRHREATHTMNLVQAALARQLRQARPLYVDDGTEHRRLAFSGDTDRLSYIAPLSRRDKSLYLITLHREHRPAGDVLRLDFMPWRPGMTMITEIMDGADDDNTVELLSGVRELDIAYFGAVEPNAPATWHARWNHAYNLPERIRIRIVADDMRAYAWPDLTICPDGGANCLIQRNPHPGGLIALRAGDDHVD